VALTWRKSSYSDDQGECVEIAMSDSVVGVRDSKNAAGPLLTFTDSTWQAFLPSTVDERAADRSV
jgi:hypothetical protein